MKKLSYCLPLSLSLLAAPLYGATLYEVENKSPASVQHHSRSNYSYQWGHTSFHNPTSPIDEMEAVRQPLPPSSRNACPKKAGKYIGPEGGMMLALQKQVCYLDGIIANQKENIKKQNQLIKAQNDSLTKGNHTLQQITQQNHQMMNGMKEKILFLQSVIAQFETRLTLERQLRAKLPPKLNTERLWKRAMTQNDVSLARHLFTHFDLDINKRCGKEAPLHWASRKGWLEMIQFLVDEGADTNIKNDKDRIPLYHAIQARDLPRAHLLVVKRKTRLNDTDIDGQTPLHLAALHNDADMVLFLIEQGASTNVRNNRDKIALHYAAINDNPSMIRMLLRGKANINARDHAGITPLYLATQKGNTEAVITLLHEGADVTLPSQNGWTALHVAAFNTNNIIVQMLMRDPYADPYRAAVDGTTTPMTLARRAPGIIRILQGGSQ